MTLSIFFTYIGPLATASVTLTLWLLLVVLQSPRPYWRDTLNVSIAGMLFALSALLALWTLDVAGVSWAVALDRRGLVVLAGLFALLGLPRTLRQLRIAIDRRRHLS